MVVVTWEVGSLSVAMMEIEPEAMATLREHGNPFMTGIPIYWTMVDGEPEWWPETLEGWPRVRVVG